MDFENREKLIKKEVTDILKKFHKGESLGLSITAILEVISTLRNFDENKVNFILRGLKLPTIQARSTLGADSAYVEGFNEAANQSNFAIDLAITSFKELNDEEKT